VAWLLLGAVVGAAAIPPQREGGTHTVRGAVVPASGLLALTGLAVISLSIATAIGQPSTATQTHVLATGQANALPEGAVFVSVIELPQAAGATLGPHGHVPGFAYVLQ